jgi:hypothetical protein
MVPALQAQIFHTDCPMFAAGCAPKHVAFTSSTQQREEEQVQNNACAVSARIAQHAYVPGRYMKQNRRHNESHETSEIETHVLASERLPA